MNPQTTQPTPTTPLHPADPVPTACPSSAVTPTSPSPSPHPHSSFAAFTKDQLVQISAWLDDHIYDEVIKLTKNKYKRTLSRSALNRFYLGTALKNRLADTPDTEAAAAQILEYAATGQPNFTEASLRVLEQTGFQLSATCHQQPEDLAILNRITQIITRQKNTAVRERHATVQEEKLRLRRDELKARQVEVEVRERQKQQQLDLNHDKLQLQRDQFEFQKQQTEKNHPTRNSPTGGTSYASPCPDLGGAARAASSLLSPMPNEKCSIPNAQWNSSSVSSVLLPSTPPKDPHAHIKGNNYYDQTNNKIWTLATETPALPFTDTAMEHRDRRNPLPPVDHSLTAAVQDFADRAAQDYIQYLADPPRPLRPNSTDYDYYRKRTRGCPCGQPKFCDRHIFIALFSYAHPWSHAFRQCLLDRGLPYVPPTLPFPGNKPNI